MDEYLFRTHLEQCKFVEETTSWIEILNYSVRKAPNMSHGWERGGEGLGKAGYGEKGRGNGFVQHTWWEGRRESECLCQMGGCYSDQY